MSGDEGMDLTPTTLFDGNPGAWPYAAPRYATGMSLDERFALFHRANPWVAKALEALTADLVARGRTRIGIGMLFEVLRWQHSRQTVGDDFKLNNSYRSRYARLLMELHPEWEGLFEIRRLHT